MTEGSLQLRRYLRLRRAHMPTEQAAAECGFSIAGARLTDADEARGLLAHIDTTEPAAAVPATSEEPSMARSRGARAAHVEEVHKPDFALAAKIWREDIRPAQGKVGEFAQEQSTAYKAIKKDAHIQPGAAKAAFRLVGMEESKRDDYLRSFNGLLRELKIFMPSDLVDQAQGNEGAGGGVVPTGERQRPKLATVPTGPADNSDLADGAGGELQAAE